MRPPARVGFATSAQWPHLTDDDRLAAAALRDRGVHVEPVVWTDPGLPRVDTIVVRSTWDYHHRPGEFIAWMDRCSVAGIRLWNPAGVLRWNLDKRYLHQVEGDGVAMVPTLWADAACPPLARVLADRGWDDVVVKPAVSASGWRTFRASPHTAAAHERRFRETLSGGSAMIQPFLSEIAAEGEWSLVFLGGRYSHAVLKRPAPGGFLVQKEHGGSYAPATPPPAMRADAEHAIAKVPGPLLYARVDGIRRDSRLVLVELELLEPDLFLRTNPGAAERLADALITGPQPASPVTPEAELR